MGYILYNKDLKKTELEFLQEEFLKLGIYHEFKKQFKSKSVNVLWTIFEYKTNTQKKYADWS